MPVDIVQAECLVISGPGEALRRCAAGDISPELTLIQLLSQVQSEQETESVLGTAIWDALEDRDGLRAERLAQVQKLWNRRRQKVQNLAYSL